MASERVAPVGLLPVGMVYKTRGFAPWGECEGDAEGVCVAADTEKEGDEEHTKYLVQLSSDCTEHRFVVAH